MKYAHFDILSAQLTTSDTIGGRPDFTSNLVGVDKGEPIRLNHVSNAMHVLLGARPVSTKWSSWNRERCKKIDDMVSSGVIKVTTPYVSNTGKYPSYACEFIKGKKSARNSNRQDLYTKISDTDYCKGIITWRTLELRYRYQKPEKYDKIMSALRDFTGLNDPKEAYSFAELLRKIGKSDFCETMRKVLTECEATPLIQVMAGATDLSNVASFNSETAERENTLYVNLAARANNVQPLYKITINAEVIIPMEDEDYKNLLNGKRNATILEGGLIRLAEEKTTDFVDLEELVDEGYKVIGNLK